MFFDKWIPKKYLVKQEIAALEVNFHENGTIYYFTWLKNKGKKLTIELTSVVAELNELPKQIIKNKIPLSIIINGKGVIIKKIDLPNDGSWDINEIIRHNLPTINSEEFCVQLYPQVNNSAFISLCRKEQLNGLLDQLKQSKYDVADVYIGSPSIIGLQPLWASLNHLETSTHSVELTNGVVESIQTSTSHAGKVKIDDLEVEQNYTLGFATGLSYLMRNNFVQSSNMELKHIHDLHVEKNKFRFLTITAVAIAFLVAIINVLFFTNYFDRNNKLETELSVYQGKYDQINKLLNDYQSKKELIESAGILNKNKLSEYADRIGATIPEEVILSHMYFNPKNEDIESEDSLVKFENKRLVIKGNCNKSLVVNEWLNVLKMQKFIKDVSLEKFSYNKDGALPNFEIKIITE